MNRYSRQLAYWGAFTDDPLDYQLRLAEATAVILGAGAGGSHIAWGLAASGIGRIIIIDPDKVDSTNLHRQASYLPADVGEAKVSAIHRHISEFNPDVEVVPIQKQVGTAEELIKFTHGANLLINCADEPDSLSTSCLVSEAGMYARIPHMVGGGYKADTCFLSVTVVPGLTPCFTCMRLCLGLYGQNARSVASSRSAGVLGPVSTITANLHLMEVLRILTGYVPPAFTHRWVHLDLSTLTKAEHSFAFHPLCPWCHGLV